MNEFNLSEFNFDFPPELIAERTAGKGNTRILYCPRNGGERKILSSREIISLFKAGDCLVVNNTKVIPARLFGETPHGGKAEILLVRSLVPAENGNARWEASVKPGRAFSAGKSAVIGGVNVHVENILADGTRVLEFETTPAELEKVIHAEGHVPLPPYIRRADDQQDKEDYQTIFAKYSGAVAAPTASLHFSEEMLEELKNKGVFVAEVTLHVGLGTFQNISAEDYRKHQMHGEHYEITEENAQMINRAKQNGGRIISVGTTCTRVLESVAADNGFLTAQTGVTRAFIYPGYRFKVIDGLLTNFHWPKSSLILLVSAFYGKEQTLEAYRFAVENKLKLFSYGDGMLIL
ncbi:MAG: tRNA preQ1(34) S-adenosylmethionine ribosyltransferase-isomerase QueA [Fibrobacter sp.]|jgi:S-adenosylmethionine:tRNA ribosyltransferase-isomerase|nr:tRNA preQ1(34) S-adenosylmethionine ribosyltransferase-isomerase QueA [Fibrobacter sp.]